MFIAVEDDKLDGSPGGFETTFSGVDPGQAERTDRMMAVAENWDNDRKFSPEALEKWNQAKRIPPPPGFTPKQWDEYVRKMGQVMKECIDGKWVYKASGGDGVTSANSNTFVFVFLEALGLPPADYEPDYRAHPGFHPMKSGS
jgi:hypothetical protein